MTGMDDAERMKIAIDLIDSQSRDTQLLEDYNTMITNILVLLLRSYPSLEATKSRGYEGSGGITIHARLLCG